MSMMDKRRRIGKSQKTPIVSNTTTPRRTHNTSFEDTKKSKVWRFYSGIRADALNNYDECYSPPTHQYTQKNI